MRLPFKTWAPDLPGLAGVGTMDTASGVYPYDAGYKPMSALVDTSNAIAAAAISAFAAKDSTGATYIFCGDTSHLYYGVAPVGSFSAANSGLGASYNDPWEFAQYKDTIIVTNKGGLTGSFTMGISPSTAFSAGTLPGGYKHVGVVRDFVVLGNSNTGTADPRQVRWSAFLDPNTWTAGVNQSDSQSLPDAGDVQRITSGEVGHVFQEFGITRMTYVGPPLIFRFDKVSHRVGLGSPKALAQVGGSYFFWSYDGFRWFDGANEPIPIGTGKVDEWFAANANLAYANAISTAVDPINKLVKLAFVSNSASSPPVCDTILIWNYVTQEWSSASYSGGIECIFSVPRGTTSYVGAFDGANHKLAGFTGSNLAAVLESSDFEPVEGKRSLITNVRPLCDTSSATGIIESRARFADSTTNTSSASMQANGDIPVLSDGRYHRVKISIAGGVNWTYANGVDVDVQEDGEI